MTNLNQTDSAKIRLQALIDTLQIKRIIYIDDENNYLQSIIEIINSSKDTTEYQGINERARQFLDGLENTDITNISDEQYRGIISRKKIIHDSLRIDKQEVMSAGLLEIEAVFPDKIITPLDLPAWTKHKSSYLESDDNILFIIDKELNAVTKGYRSGLDILKEIQNAKRPNLFACMYTGLITPGREKEAINTFSKEADLQQSSFYVISKSASASELAAGFELSVLAAAFVNFLDPFLEASKEAYDESLQFLKSLSIEIIEGAVLNVSMKDGTDRRMLLQRIFMLAHRKNLFKNLHVSEEITRALDTIYRIRRVNPTPISPEVLTGIKQIQRSEKYDDEDIINRLLTPIDLGDIFSIKTLDSKTEETYILVNAQCDLALRTGGSRSLSFGTLLKFSEPEKFAVVVGETEPTIPVPTNRYYKLKYYAPLRPVYIDMGSEITLPLGILDSCSINTDGKAHLDLGSDLTHVRSEVVKKSVKKFSSDIEKRKNEFATQMGDMRLRGVILASTGFESPLHVDINNNVIEYKVQRIGRLLQPYSGDLLIRYSRYISRYGFETPFDYKIV